LGLDAEVVAIGPFSPAIAGRLDYPPDFYKNTREGATVITLVFQALTSRQSHELAECFGVEAFDFNRHHLNPRAVDVERLRQIFDPAEVERFLALRQRGFDFYYRPNG
jgi:hypothetical protein